MFSYNKKMATYHLFAIFLIVIDRFFKFLASSDFFWPPIELIPSLLQLNFTGNENIAFSLPLGGFWLNILIIALIITLCYIFIFYFKNKKLLLSLLVFTILLGAASNFFDRLKYGFVVDYFELRHFAVFNLADAMITSGAAAIIFLEWRRGRQS